MHEKVKTIEKQKSARTDSTFSHYSSPHHGIECPNCHQTVGKDNELCPHCGFRLHANHCTFCGAAMDPEDLFCGECGGSAKGIKCPHCGTLSFRSFCPKCNEAIDELGKEELQKAKADPLYQRICSLAEQIIEAQESSSPLPHEDELRIEKILEKYRDLHISSDMPIEKPYHEERAETAEQRRSRTGSQAIRLTGSDGLPTDLSSAIEELNSLLRSMVPDPGLTPQMQRNYYCARKVAVYRKSKVKETVGWVCNLCGCQHHSPSECARPELGGTWIYREKEITTKTYE